VINRRFRGSTDVVRVALASAIAVLAIAGIAVASSEKSEPRLGPDEPVSSGPISSGQQPSGEPADTCTAETGAGERRRQLSFEVSCDFEPFRVVVDPDRRVLAARANAEVEGGDPQGDPGQEFSCEVVRGGESVECTGQAENGATIRSRMIVGGDRCRTKTRFVITGGVDCDGDEVCIELAVIAERTDRRPSGC
jgi:hypothetical protein